MPTTLNGIQSLRAFAAYAVVAYHVFEGLHAVNPETFPRFVLGQAGVDLFFVISGFIMVHITRAASETPVGFMSKRIARIVPLYWVVTAATVAAAVFAPWAFPAINLAPESIAASFFFVPHPNTVGTPVPVHVVGWTLNFEMMFYLLFAVSMMISSRWRVPIVIALIAIGGAVARLFEGPIAEFYGYYVAFNFAYGCIIAVAINSSIVRKITRNVVMWPFALAAVAYLVLLVPDISNFSPYRALYYGLPATVLVFACVAQDLHRTPVRKTWLNHLGDTSYSAYLLHPLVITAFVGVIDRTIGFDLTGGLIFFAGTMIVTAIVAAASFVWIERPSNHLLRRAFRLGSRRTKEPAAAG